MPIRIGIIADFNARNRYHIATNDSIKHAAEFLQIEALPVWLDTDSLNHDSAESRLNECDGLWAGTSSPYRSMDGALRGIRFAREHLRPFIGT